MAVLMPLLTDADNCCDDSLLSDDGIREVVNVLTDAYNEWHLTDLTPFTTIDLLLNLKEPFYTTEDNCCQFIFCGT